MPERSSKLISSNPSRNFEVVGEVDASTKDQVEDAVTQAHAALTDWAALSVTDRCRAVGSFVQKARNQAEDIATLVATETGRPISSSRHNVASGIEYFDSYLEMAEKALQPHVTLESESEIHRVVREPWGVVAAICPWNYPFLNVAWQCGQALLAGNTVVYKNSEENPLFAQLLARLIAESEIPSGVFNVIYGDSQVGDWLVRSNVNLISFTGSTAVGRKLARIAADNFIPFVAELGGSAPLIVFPDVDDTDSAEFIVDRRFKNAGQSCDAVKRLIVHERLYGDFVDALDKAMSTRKIGDALDDDTVVGPLISKRQQELIEAQVEDAREKGAKIVTGGRRPAGLHGAYYEPTLLTFVTTDMRVWQEETFGPVLPMISFKSEEEAIELANDTIYGLGAHVLTADKTLFRRVAAQIKSGMVAHNHVSYAHPENPFGGYKQSGMGRTNGQFGFQEMTQVKLISEEK
jgi:acyl-CoA reductase-like NAD-dependent aldehyde dehydrogenase